MNSSTDTLHNMNCYHYLKQVMQDIDAQDIQSVPLFSQLKKIEGYHDNVAYGDLYTELMNTLNDELESLYQRISPQIMDLIVYRIYHNQCPLFQNTQFFINILKQEHPTQSISNLFIENNKPVNHFYPHKVNAVSHRAGFIFSSHYNPQAETNIPTMNLWSHDNQNPREYRFVTQVQRIKGQLRVSPLFLKWLEIHAQFFNSMILKEKL